MKKIIIANQLINYMSIFIISILLLSCEYPKKEINNYTIPITFYKKGFPNKIDHSMSVEYKNTNGNKLFTYKCEELQPGIKILKIDSIGNLFYDGQELQLVDIKTMKIGDSLIELKKYINANTSGLYDLSYFYLNDDYGLFLTQNLIYNNIIEYDTERFKQVHKKIMDNTLLFKDSDYVIQMDKELRGLNKNSTDSL